MKPIYTAQALASDGRNGRVESSDKRLKVDLSHPLQDPRIGDGTDPEQLFAAAYAACFGSSLELAARLLSLPWAGPAKVESTVELYIRPGGKYNIRVELVPHVTGLLPEQVRMLMEKAHNICPYSHALQNNVDVVTHPKAG